MQEYGWLNQCIMHKLHFMMMVNPINAEPNGNALDVSQKGV